MLDTQAYARNLLLECDFIVQCKFNGKMMIIYNLSSDYRSEIVKVSDLYAMGIPKIKFHSASFIVCLLENPSLCFLFLW